MSDHTDGGDGGSGRSRRTRADKSGRFAALQKFKKAKAEGKRDFMFEEESNVYDVVEESEYSKLVQDRLEDDWIVDDGSGYVEDGREVFDDEYDDDKKKKGGASSKSEAKKQRRDPNIQRPETSGSIKSMFAASAVANKKRPKIEASAATLDEDELFGDILSELQSDAGSQKALKPGATKIKKEVYNPFSKPIRKKTIDLPKPSPTSFSQTTQEKPKKTTIPKPKPKAKPEPEPEIEFDVPEIDDVPDIAMETEAAEPEIEEVVEDTNNNKETEKKPDVDDMDIRDVDFDDDFELSSQPKVTVKEEMKELKPVVTKSKPTANFTQFAAKSEFETTPPASDQSAFGEIDLARVPLVKNEAGDEVLRFYWLDAFEDQYNQPGTVYLFGKVYVEKGKPPVSCCLAVKNVERKVYLLPREYRMNMKAKELTAQQVTIMDVYNEFNTKTAEKYKINRFRSCKASHEYAFEKPGIPAECEYLEVRYSADNPQLPLDLEGETFSHAFGTNQSFLESFLLDRKLKGPCWLDIKTPQKPNPPISWCQLEIVCSKPDHVIVTKETLATPPVTVMTISLKTVVNQKTHENEIVSLACLVHSEFAMDKPAPKQHFTDHFCAISKPSDCVYPFDFRDRAKKSSDKMKVEMMGSERHLLAFFLAKIHRIDPDILVGHDIYGFDLDVLLHRLNSNKVPHWSKIGRLKRSHMPKQSGRSGKGASFTEKSATCGRLVTDVKISAKELIRCKSYDLTELTNHVLHAQRALIEPDEIKNMYLDSRSLLSLCETNLVDGTYILRLMYELNVLPLALQITNICGNVMSRTLMGGRSERNEYLLLHAFSEQNYILPDKEYKKKAQVEDDEDEDGGAPKKTQGRRKPAYAGGLVLEPKKGFYDKYILLLDFNSLYPSIIQEYNICFTTINRDTSDKPAGEGEEDVMNLELPDPTLKPGILPTEIRKLVESRKQVKALMKGSDVTPEMMMQYDIRQKALKLTANSMYGCLGFSYSRFYAKPLAALVTGKGREILMKTKDLAEKMNLEVIYGDTDSIMINTNSTDMETVFKLGNKVKAEVNKLYRLLEIDIDSVFKSMLLLKKKKYAALSITKSADGKITENQELKGLDIVRRDWCELAKQAGNFVVQQILSGEEKEKIVENIHSKLMEVGEDVAKGTIPVELYYITKALTKNPEDYPDKKSLPHVQVALRVNSKGGKRMRSGDTVYYVICQDGSALPASQRAYHPDELAKSDTLKIDTKYYLSSQVHPVVQRLCDPIDGTDAARIAECLGLDPSSYKHAIQRSQEQEQDAALGLAGLSDEERYKDCERFKVKCPCGKEMILDSAFTGTGADLQPSLSSCGLADCTESPSQSAVLYMNQMTMKIRHYIKLYYQGWLLCEDPACANRTCKLPLETYRGMPVCPQCRKGVLRPEYTDSMLYNQLCFYQYIFDLDKAIAALPENNRGLATNRSQPFSEVYRRLKSVADKAVSQNAYAQVDLGKLFAGLVVPKNG